MTSQKVRRAFLDYFKQKGHSAVSSSPVIPHDDPTLLFINAGMNQFKDVFLGKSVRDYKKACTSQKCIRVGGKHNDLDNVGHTARHLTFFEMLGNFSFGDYFKKEAIAFSWEVTLEVFGFDPKFLWASVFHEDEESFELWKAFLPEERIVRMGEADNFWSMGDVGPCGPCSELYYDKGVAYGHARSPAEDISGERFLEFWNLVFMEYNRDGSGEMSPLPKKCVDTGAGLERVVSLQMGVESLFETDVLSAIIKQVSSLCGKRYKKQPAFHVIADHLRSLAFAIADGVQPSNLDRGYVLRKVLRRAVRYGRQLGFERPFLAETFPVLLDQMGSDFPELVASKERICEILTLEEEGFLRTLKRGGNILNQIVAHSQKSKQINGEDAFKLKDTYGLPLEEIMLLAKDAGLGVDINRFEELEHEAKQRSRSSRKVAAEEAGTSEYEAYVSKHEACDFLGFGQLTSEAVVLGLMKAGQPVTSLQPGEEGVVLLNKTPFYAEMGGQVGDQGSLQNESVLFEVTDCTSPYTNVVAHLGVLKSGSLAVGDQVTATVDAERRQKIANNHTATHLLHWALVQVLGPHIKQAGSVVDQSRLRFDFSHHKPLGQEEIQKIEQLVNEKIRENRKVDTYELSYSEAQKRSDIKQFFGEKYGNTVRVVDIDFSKELCGGTHTHAIGSIGYFRIATEGSIAAGVRRIEAVTGLEAEKMAWETERSLHALTDILNVQPTQIRERIEKLVDENKQLQKELAHVQQAKLATLAKEMLAEVKTIGKTPYLGKALELSSGELKELADLIMEKKPSLLLLLLSKHAGKCAFLARVSKDLNLHAGELIKTIAPTLGGKGGGKPDFAQGGGTQPEKIPEALEQADAWITSKTS